MIRRVAQLVVCAAVIAFLAACQADVTVDLTVAEDGSGVAYVQTVFDAEANAALGDVATQARVQDLERAGWRVTVGETGDATAEINATYLVEGPEQWQSVLDQIAGPGVFNNVAVTPDKSFASSKQRLAFDLDLSQGWDLFSDDGVADALDGEPFGAPLDSLTRGRTIDQIISLDLIASVSSDDGATPSTRTYTPRFDDSQRLQVVVESQAENTTALLIRWISMALFALFALAAILAVTGIVLQRRSDRLRPPPKPASLASRVPGAAAAAPTTPAAAAAAAAPTPQADSVRLVVLDAVSVLYQQSRAADAHLLPFVRQHDGTARADTILDGYKSVVDGSLDTDAFWRLCGVDTDQHPQLDDTYVAQRALRPGAVAFFDEMSRRRIPIAAISDDAAIWSNRARERDRLSSIWPWLVSSEVRTMRSTSAMFEVLRRESGVAHGHCLFVDTDIDSLDVARSLGIKTALFDTGDLDLPDVIGHPVVTDFKALFG